MPTRKKKSDHSPQCQAYEAASKRQQRNPRPGDQEVIDLGRGGCSSPTHNGTRHKRKPREATMSAPVAPPDSKPKKAKVSTRRGVDRPAQAALPHAEHHRGRAAMVLMIAAALATLNWAILTVPLGDIVSGISGQQAAAGVVLAEVLACMIFMDAIGRTHMIGLISEAPWYWRGVFGLAGLALMGGMIALEVGLGDMRDVTHQMSLATQAVLLHNDDAASSATQGLDDMVKSHAWIATYVQRGLGVILPLLNMFAVMPLETLLQSFKRRPKSAPVRAPSPRTEEPEALADKAARWPWSWLRSTRA